MKISIVVEALTGTFITDMNRASKEAQRFANDVEKQFKRMGVVIGAAVVTGATALAALTKSAINTADQISKTAQKVGISTESLSQLAHAAKLADVDMGLLQTGLMQLNKRASEAAQGNEQYLRTFKALGIEFKNADGSLRNVDELFAEVAESIRLIPGAAERSRIAMDLFGKSGANLIPMLKDGKQGFKDAADEAKRLGLVISGEAGRQAEQFNDDLLRLKLAADGLGTQIATQLLPDLILLVGQIKAFTQESGAARSIATFVANEINGIARAVRGTKQELEVLAGYADKLKATISFDQEGFDTAVRRMEQAQANLRDPTFMAGGLGEWIDPSEQLSSEKRAREANAAAVEEERKRMEQLRESLKGYFTDSGAAGEAAKAFSEEMKAQQAIADALTQEYDEFSRAQQDLAAEMAGPLAQAQLEHKRSMDDLQSKLDRGVISVDEMTEAQHRYGEQLKKTRAALDTGAPQRLLVAMKEEIKLLGMTTKQRSLAVAAMQAQAEMQSAINDAQANGANLSQKQIDELLELAKGYGEAGEEARELESILSKFEDLGLSGIIRDIERMEAALKKGTDEAGNLFNADQIATMRTALGAYRQEAVLFATDAIGQGISALQSMASEGSKAYKALEVAQAANNLVAAIGAVLNQGSGDPYTAFARMAAMAAAVGQLVGSIGAFSGSSGPSAALRQDTQGTGTVLGDAAADSESIANAVEITAKAAQELVGINRGMLSALQAMQAGIAGASNILAQGSGGSAGLTRLSGGPSLPSIGGSSSHSLFVQAFANIFGGKESLRDTGIRIVGGALSDMIDDIMVQSYATIHRSGGWFSSSRNFDRTEELGDDVSRQFQLVLESMADAVREGAEALGLNLEAINAAIAAYEIEEIRISTMDLSAEEAQAELEAVFSSIFDGLAGDVVPFIDQFQQVGEGLGETLVRVATEVQVTQEAVRRLGFVLDDTLGPEAMAQVSDALVQASGGIESFIDGMSTFMQAFASDAHLFAVAEDEITRALDQVGLSVPATREAMWALMQSLDAGTESGREQIATLLRLAGVADAYYTGLEDQAEAAADALEEAAAAMQAQTEAALDYAAVVNDINRQLAEFSGASEFQLTLQDIAGALNTNVARLNETARAAGLLSAREEDLGRAHLLAAAQAARAMAQLEEAGRSLASDLYGSALGDIDAEIARIEAESTGASSAIGGFGDAMREAAEVANRATDLLLGDLSPLRDRQKLPLALQAFQQGKIEAEQVLQIGRRLFASGQDYNQLFDQVLAIERTRGGTGMGGGGGGGNFSSSSQSDSRLEALLARRAEIEAAQADAARFAQASDLAQIVADLAGARGEDFGSVLGSLSGGRATLEQFAADLGLDGLGALDEYLRALQADSYGITDIAATITAGDRYIVDALREIFDYQQLREAKPDSVTDLFTKPLDVPVLLPGAEGKPITVAPPTEPTPGERIIGDGIDGLDTRIRQVEFWLEKIARHTGISADADNKKDKRDAGAASWEAGAKPRSTRSDLVKPGY